MKQPNIDSMRLAGRTAAATLKHVGNFIRPGITTEELNRIVHNDTIKRGGYPAPLNYKGFPKSCCTSVNDVVCHGIPGQLVLNDGDIVNVDVTTIVDGHFGDTNATFFVGEPSNEVKRLVEVTLWCLNAAIAVVCPGVSVNVIGRKIQEIADDCGYGIVREFGGHGVGVRFHTPPHVNHFDSVGADEFILRPGVTFTIEPMLNMGTPNVSLMSDGWTVRTADGAPSAQFEHTLLVTDDGCEVLTHAESDV